MRKSSLSALADHREGHFLKDLMPGEFIYRGGLSFSKPGQRSHTNDGPDGRDYHVHEDCEAFVILQGKGEVEVDGTKYPITVGDIVSIEPGEDHHLIADEEDPLLTLYLHAGPTRKI